jgi:hypothetical protein
MVVPFIMARMPIAAVLSTILIDVHLTTAQIVLQTIVFAILLLVILHF